MVRLDKETDWRYLGRCFQFLLILAPLWTKVERSVLRIIAIFVLEAGDIETSRWGDILSLVFLVDGLVCCCRSFLITRGITRLSSKVPGSHCKIVTMSDSENKVIYSCCDSTKRHDGLHVGLLPIIACCLPQLGWYHWEQKQSRVPTKSKKKVFSISGVASELDWPVTSERPACR